MGGVSPDFIPLEVPEDLGEVILPPEERSRLYQELVKVYKQTTAPETRRKAAERTLAKLRGRKYKDNE
jgi:hypothetical protein